MIDKNQKIVLELRAGDLQTLQDLLATPVDALGRVAFFEENKKALVETLQRLQARAKAGEQQIIRICDKCKMNTATHYLEYRVHTEDNYCDFEVCADCLRAIEHRHQNIIFDYFNVVTEW